MKYTLIRPFVLTTLVVASVAIFVYVLSPKEDIEAYYADIAQERKKKDQFLRLDPDSPLGASANTFDSLQYFPTDIRYRVIAKLVPIEKKQVRVLTTSTGEQTKYLEYAWAYFLLGRDEFRLLILEIMDMGPNRGKLFLAFADETSARETYGGGRYLDLKKIPAATSIELDFNLAYNPYCAYNDSYSCPLPPKENILHVPIKAGELTFRKHGEL